MSELAIEINWKRQEDQLVYGEYSRVHEVIYNETLTVLADTAPDYGGDVSHTNPEQTLAAALSSCHMMTFLALSAKSKWPVRSYQDRAVAYLGENEKGQTIVNRIDLHPKVVFDEGFEVSEAKMEKMQDRAHRYCFIANTLDSKVQVNINPETSA